MTTDLIARLQAKKRNATEEEDDALAALEAKERENAELKAKNQETAEQFVNFIHKEHSEVATERDTWKARAEFSYQERSKLEKERDALAEQNMALMNALEMLQGSWIEYGLPKTDRSFQISEAALATGGK